MRPTPTSAFRPRLNFTVALGLGIISSTAVGCVATPSSAEPPSRVKAKTVEVVATNGETVVVIDGERHVGEVRMDQASEMMMLVDGDAQVRQFPIPAGALRGWSSNNEPGRNRPRAVMLTGSEPPRARLGISMAETDAGVLVEGVMPGTAAERSGLREGDVIVAIGGDREDMRSVDTSALSELISNRSPGETVRMKIVRGDEILTLSSTLGVADNSAGSGGNDLEGHQMEAIARQIEAQIREMLGDQAGDGEIVMNFEFNEEFDEDNRHEGRDEDDRHEGRNELWEEMFRYVEGMMEEAHHETAGWMEDMAEHAGHWAEEAEHRLHEFAEMSDHRMHEFAETFEHELQRVMERQEEGRHETEMMFRERDLDLRERGMEFQDRLGESNRNLQETLQRFAEQNQQLAEENRRLNERVGRLEQAFRNLMGGSRDSDARNGDEQRRRMMEEAKRSERQNAEEMKQRAVERMQRSAERGEKAEQRRRKASDRSQQRGAARGKKPAKDSERDRD